MRQLFMAAIVIFNILFCSATYAQTGVLAPIEPQAGKDYTVLSTPVPTSEPNKIEVTEIFWYGCPHCYHLDPILNTWAATLPKDINFIRMPALFSKLWDIHGQLFITLDTLSVEHKLHTAVFDSIQTQKNLLLTPNDMANFVAEHGVDRQKFLETFNSFGVKTKMEKDKKLLASYGVSGVPAMIINGKYRVEMNESVPDAKKLMEVTNYLIEKERSTLKSENTKK